MASGPKKRRPTKASPVSLRHVALGIGAFVAGTAALAAGAIAYASRKAAGDATPEPLASDAADGPAPNRAQVRDQAAPLGDEGHAASDLAADATPGERAPQAFRPDMDAPMSDAEREALRPATGPQPTLVDAGTSLPAGH